MMNKEKALQFARNMIVNGSYDVGFSVGKNGAIFFKHIKGKPVVVDDLSTKSKWIKTPAADWDDPEYQENFETNDTEVRSNRLVFKNSNEQAAEFERSLEYIVYNGEIHEILPSYRILTAHPSLLVVAGFNNTFEVRLGNQIIGTIRL